ncbi:MULTISPECIES: hypothetical protein [Bacteroides]|uniref:hypothetical protein n=1 Tax=Bacteroides TaxID=816 RepID=UPI000B394BBE|nr:MULTISPECIES: hypothetical protein [Bacteroides]MBU3808449.1 hypothetical protein [Candidatus Phocaeicola faecipullorum]MBM6719555.1 hypothetical protein [Bacteroides gallinaceum]MBM6946341.1 hypothetical protein [Bacteroides gallinaceum]OUO50214.1 hypothetical protein B5F78_14125 [Bacteroides sp. An279]OUP31052.1 hypothetical protein B5F25_12360 [Bacteroides sp. An19]
MDLMKFKGVDNAVKMTIRLSIGYCVILTIAFITCIIYQTIKLEKAYSQALVIDKNGEVYKASGMPASNMRRFEYINHVKTFVGKWYAFDENTYEGNIASALNLIGNKGKELLNEYNDVNMLNSLVQKNIRYGVSIDEITIDMGTIPVTGKILFTQTGYRARGKVSRKVEAEFSIYDVSRSEENAHGAKIEDWIVHYSAPIEDNQEEYNNQPENSDEHEN